MSSSLHTLYESLRDGMVPSYGVMAEMCVNVADALRLAYQEAGMPYGDSDEAFRRWVRGDGQMVGPSEFK